MKELVETTPGVEATTLATQEKPTIELVSPQSRDIDNNIADTISSSGPCGPTCAPPAPCGPMCRP